MFDESCGAMEKQAPRQLPGPHKGNGAPVERRNDFTPNRNGRQKRWKDSCPRPQESPVAISKPAQKWCKPNSDKRPRQRGHFEDRQREEVAEDEDVSYEDEPIYASTSRKGNGNHLLSFQYERRGAQQISSHRYRSVARPRYTNKTSRYKKEQFLKASFQFVVPDTGQYVEQAIDPDAFVDWDQVELVRDYTPQEVKCSICLMPPMAGKMTRCGHTFCWACILHYLTTDESKTQGCPLCHQPVVAEELRSVQHIVVSPVKEGEELEMKLMRKNKGFVYVCPKADWLDKKGEPLNIHDGVATTFNKLMVASTEQIYNDVIESEKAALAIQLLDAEDYEGGYIRMAQSYLEKRALELKERIRTSSTSSAASETVEFVREEEPSEEKAPLPADMSFDGTQIATTYSDAFEDEADSGMPPSPSVPAGKPRNVSVGEEAIPFETLHRQISLSESQSGGEEREAISEDQDGDEQYESSSAMSDSMPVLESTLTASEAADHLELPYESQGAGEARRANRSKDVYYFYQASTGQHIYLNSLNVRCLMKEYGSLESSPDTITGTVVAIDRIFIDEEMRKRFRYLNHIPLTSEIQIVELKLQAPIVSKETLKTFQAEFERRRKHRKQKQRNEKARAKKYEDEQKAKNPEYYPDYTIVTSDQFTRPHSTSELSSAADVTLGESPGSVTPTPGDESGTSLGDEGTSPNTVSFAQIIKSGKSAAAAPLAQSPRPHTMSTSYSAPALRQVAAAVEEEEEEGRPPSYSAAMFQALDNVKFWTPVKEGGASSSPQSSGGGKKKKKKEKQVLFSTAMARKT